MANHLSFVIVDIYSDVLRRLIMHKDKILSSHIERNLVSKFLICTFHIFCNAQYKMLFLLQEVN